MSESPPPGKPSPHLSLVAALLAAIMAWYVLAWLLGWGTGLGGDQAPMPLLLGATLLIHVLWPLCIAAVVFAGAASTGLLVLGVLRCGPRGPLERLLFGLLIGLGFSAYATFALGTVGMLQPVVFWALAVLMVLAGLGPLRRTLCEAGREGARWAASWSPLERLLAGVGAAVVLVAVLSAATPVLDYDTLEYHLGAPGEYFASGGIRFLRHNVYACFPEHVEMLYLMGITMAGGKAAGMGAALQMQALFGLTTALLTGCLAVRAAGQRTGLPAAVFFLSCPLIALSVLSGHDTLARCAYKAGGLVALAAWLQAEPADRRRWIVLCGLCLGLAVAVKYTAAVTLCVPVGLVVLVLSLKRGRTWAERLGQPVALGALALAAASPWFARNLAETGNPVFPLLYGLFGGRGWSPEQAAKFAHAHAAAGFSGMGLALWRFLASYRSGTFPDLLNPLAIVFAPALVLWRLGAPRERDAEDDRPRAAVLLTVAGYAVAFALIWAVGTHRVSRFLAPCLVALAVLSAAGFRAASRSAAGAWAAGALAVVLGLYGVYSQAAQAYAWGGLGAALQGEGLPALSRSLDLKGITEYVQAVEMVNRSVPPGDTVMLVGEARVYHFKPRVLYSVVFNDHPIEPALRAAARDPREGARLLKQTGAGYVLVNWLELRRLTESYSFPYKGATRPGYLPELDWRAREPLESLLKAAGRRVASLGSMPWPDEDSPGQRSIIDIYALDR